MNATITTNPEFNGIEIRFAEKPARCTLDALKAQGFRWHNKKALWYAKNTLERMEAAQSICNIGDYALQVLAEEAAEARPAYGKGKKKPAEKPQPVNKYGVKVGDVFYESWGYEQTNIDFWQVVALKGTTQIVLKAISGETVEDCGFCSCMVRPVKNAWSSHYAGEQITRTVKGTTENPYCNAEHGLLYQTTWDTAHNQTSYY